MAQLYFILNAQIHLAVSRKDFGLHISGDMIAPHSWTGLVAAQDCQLGHLFFIGNQALEFCFVQYVHRLPPQMHAFSEIMKRCVLHPNVYTQLFLKTGVFALQEEPSNYETDRAASGAFVLLCAMLFTHLGPETFFFWFRNQFGPLFDTFVDVLSLYTCGGHLTREPATRKKTLPSFGLSDGPSLFRSRTLLHMLKDRWTTPTIPSYISAPDPCPVPDLPVPIFPLPDLSVPILPAPSVFASVSTLEKEHLLRSRLVARRRNNDNPNSDVRDYPPKRRPFSEVTNMRPRTVKGSNKAIPVL
ncbi:hypothetical protein FB45DRAFT_887052 [Roridomyces roridus]|uniref:Uncharacterized protein n=1 Tax=Roridomyces roridus TaxID=1738132 RepID=A0AAD7CIR0_9AGAR|nr:hypothetical protein FB45DRAFT_887052 [Roridomyces roridus]